MSAGLPLRIRASAAEITIEDVEGIGIEQNGKRGVTENFLDELFRLGRFPESGPDHDRVGPFRDERRYLGCARRPRGDECRRGGGENLTGVLRRNDRTNETDSAAQRSTGGEHDRAGHSLPGSDDREMPACALVGVVVNRRNVCFHPWPVDNHGRRGMRLVSARVLRSGGMSSSPMSRTTISPQQSRASSEPRLIPPKLNVASAMTHAS